MTAQVAAAYFRANEVPVTGIPDVIARIAAAFEGLGRPAEPAAERPTPAVPIRKSVTPDYIVCLEDGAKLKIMKRYLRSKFGLTPEQYRDRWGLPPDYPMTAPNYAAERAALAKSIGLGRGRTAKGRG
jgi:predicted transcriptional regulator